MGYQIIYGQGKMKKKASYTSKYKSLRKGICALVISVLVLAVIFGSELRRCFLPGDPEVTETALTDLVNNLKCGEPLPESITAFCRYIIDNAE